MSSLKPEAKAMKLKKLSKSDWLQFNNPAKAMKLKNKANQIGYILRSKSYETKKLSKSDWLYFNNPAKAMKLKI